MPTFFTSQHMPCPACGASVPVSESPRHACDADRRLEYRLFQLRDEIARFDESLGGYLDSPRGRFAQWLAERERRGGC
jgi:hypothetical protein